MADVDLSDVTAHAMLDARFGSGTPVTIYVALSSTKPLSDGTGVTEPVGNGYTRVAVTNNATNFPAAATRQKKNGTVINFPAATAAWGGPYTYVALFDAPTAGVFQGRALLSTAKSPTTGDQPFIAANGMIITLN